jgi:FHS family L-fucose permease-like MFS transporter
MPGAALSDEMTERRPFGEAAPLALVVLVVGLFFMWGGLTSLNDILIPKLKGLFRLSYAQAMLTQFAFFTAYAVVSVPAGWLVARLGYGRGIALGLAVMATGCLLFWPAASNAAYPLFLIALFVLAGGITILQVAANPLIANLGSAQTSHSRLTFAQAFNSLGTTVWPFIGAQIILGSLAARDPASLFGAELFSFQAREAAVIGRTYLVLALVMVVIATVFFLLRARFEDSEPTASLVGGFSLLRRPRLGFGVLSIFVYVGAEVTIGSLMVSYLMQSSTMGLPERSAGKLLAFYWGGAMLGRFIGAALLRTLSPGKLLASAALGAATLALFSAANEGPMAGYSLLAVGLMNSIMFPTIFSLALEGLGEKTPQGSGLLCMAIVGGALVPLLAGTIADKASLSVALAVPFACYLIVGAFGWYSRRPARND